MPARAVAATILLFLAAFAAAWAALVALTGGFSARAIVSRDPFRPLVVSAALAAGAWLIAPRGQFSASLRRVIGTRDTWAATIAIAASFAVLAFSTAWNTRAAGGSDSSCYALQAQAFAHGHATLAHPLARELPDSAPAMFAPGGFAPSPRAFGEAVPICAPGLSLMMAAALRLGGTGAVFLVVPICAALAVWLTFAIGRRLDDVAGAAAAVLVACSPIFLYQSVQPMSDVPAAALWLAALAGAARGDAIGSTLAGFCASAAVLTRPNLAVAVVPLVWLLRDRRAWTLFVLAALPGAIAFGALNAVRYGSPFLSGYGETGALFSWPHVAENLARYPRWIVATESPIVLLAVAAPWILRRDRDRLRLALVILLSSALVVFTYLAYTVFDDWWYIRFLLPVLPTLLVLAVFLVLAVASTLAGARGRIGVAVVLSVALGSWYLRVADVRQVLALRSLESRFVRTGDLVRRYAEDAVFIAGQQTGSIRFHGGRATLAWDAIPADQLDALVSTLESHGHHVYAALEDSEVEPFRRRFAGQTPASLDWRPLAELPAPVRVRVWDVSTSAIRER